MSSTHYLHYLLPIIPFLLLPTLSFSTCIVILKTPNEIWVGADSKRTIYQIDLNTGNVVETVNNEYCKIHKVGYFYFAVAGFDDEGNFNLATESCLKYKSITETIHYYQKMMVNHFEDIVEKYRVANRTRYIDRFVGSAIGQTAFFYFENNEPKIISLEFLTTNNPNEKVKVRLNRFNNEPITVLGYGDHLNEPNPKVESFLKQGDNANAIRAMIQTEIIHHPNEIGGAIDILFLGNKNETWIARKKNCK